MLASGARPWCVALALAACSSPPAAPAGDAGAGGGQVDAGEATDAADAAAGDAASTDAAPSDGGPDGGGPDPGGIRLVDVTGAVGRFRGGQPVANPFGVGSGAAAGDVDGDGDLDVFLARCDGGDPDYPGGPSLLLRQGEAGGFDAFASDPELAAAFADRCAFAAAFADYDADSDLDLFVAMDGPDRLLENDGSGRFGDVTARAGVAGPATARSAGAVWADVNADGLVDLYVPCQTSAMDAADDPRNADRLYLNRGGGVFEDVSADAGVVDDGVSHAAAVADFDGDPALEIYVANDRFAIDGVGANTELDPDRFYDPMSFDDEGRPRYGERSAELGLGGDRSSMGVALADLTGDDRDEIYVSDFGANHLFAWQSAGGYQDIARPLGVALPRSLADLPLVAWAARFADLDRDGAEELAVVHGSTYPAVNCYDYLQLDFLLRRTLDVAGFADITRAAGWPASPCDDLPRGMQYSGRGLVLADLDGDGDDDLVVTPFLEHFAFFRNDTGSEHRFLRVHLVGSASSPVPVGAVLEVARTDGVVLRRRLYAGGATASQSPPILEVGLGAAQVARAQLYWPSGHVQRLDTHPGFALDRTWRVVEPDWLTLSARVASAADPAPVLTVRLLDPQGAPLGPGLEVSAVRSDGVAASVVDQGDGRYTVTLPHPGSARVTTVTFEVAGAALELRPSVRYE